MSAVRPVLVPPSATRPPPGRVDEALSLLAHAAVPLQSDHIRVLLRVLGTGGTPPATPDRAAAEAGCPPSTARGLVNRAKEIARRAGPPASLLAADRLLADQIRSGADAALALYGAGLTAGVLHPDTVLLAMDWFGCVPSAAIYWLPDGTSLTVPLRQRQQVVRAPGQMRGRCLAQGIATVSDLAERAGISDELALRLLDADPRFGRLDSHVWAVPDTGRNLVRHAVRRQLGVRPHTVADLHAGIRAALRVRPGRRPPPAEALHAYLHDQPGCEVDGETARATADVDPPLVASDAVIVEAFRATCAEALSMAQLRHALSAAGFGESGTRHLVRGSPILRRAGFGRYTLSGRPGMTLTSAVADPTSPSPVSPGELPGVANLRSPWP